MVGPSAPNVSWLRRRRGGGIQGFGSTISEYDRVIQHYHDAFGAENVVVLPYEELRAGQGAFVHHIGQRLDLGDLVVDDIAPAHRSLSPRTLTLLRFSNRMLSTWGHNPGAVVLSAGAHGRLTRALRQLETRLPDRLRHTALHSDRTKTIIDTTIHGRFAASNQRTCALTGLDLGAFGYQL